MSAPSPTLAQRAIRGAAWNYGGAAFVIVGQLAYTALTARVVSPAEFGAYATAQALLMLVGYFTLGTVGNAVIRQPAINREVVGTALVLTGTAGLVVALFVFAVSGIWADAWQSPGAATLLRLYSPQVLLGALAIVPLSLLRRDLRYRSASMIETSSVLIGFGVGALLALQLRDAEALVLGQLANAAALLLASCVAARAQLAIAFSSSYARSLFSFSAQVSLQNLGHYLNNTLPAFVVSRSLGQVNLGYFSRASLLVGLPQTFLTQGVTKTLYPIYPRFRESAAECRRVMVDVASTTTAIVWPLFAALAGLAPLVVEILLGAQWKPVAGIVAPLCLYATMNFSYSIFAAFAEAFGFLRQIWLAQIFWTIVLVASLAVAVREGVGMRGIVLVAVGVQAAVHLLQIALLARSGFVDGLATLRTEAFSALMAAAWYLGTAATTQSLASYDLAVRIGAACTVVALLTLTTWLILPSLPAGRAFTRRGIRVPLHPRVSRNPS